MRRRLCASLVLVFALISAGRCALAAPTGLGDPTSDGIRRNVYLLNYQRQHRSGAGIDSWRLRESWFADSPSPADASGGILPLTLQLGATSRMHLLYGLTGPDQREHDPVSASVQGFGLASSGGAVKSESQFYLYRPQLDGGTAAALVRHYGAASPNAAVDPTRLRGGHAVRQALQVESGGWKMTGRFQQVDDAFAPAQRLTSGGEASEAAKGLQELLQQRGTRRLSLGLATEAVKGWALSGSTDALGDGSGRIRSQQFGVSGGLLRFRTSRQEVGAGFARFAGFADPEVAKLAALKGVRRRETEWALTPGKELGLEGKQSISTDAGGSLSSQSVGLRLGAFQYSTRHRAVSGFTTFGSLAATDQTLQKIAGVSLRESQAGLALGAKSRFDYKESRVSDAGGGAEDRLFALQSRAVTARARFRRVDGGIQSLAGLAAFDAQYADLGQHRGQRAALYDLDYTGLAGLGFRNHYEQVRGLQGDWKRATLANTLDFTRGRTSGQAFRSQTGGRTTAGDTSQVQERYLLRRAVQKDGFLLGERFTQVDRAADGKRALLETNRLQMKAQAWRLFAMDGQRVETNSTGLARTYTDTVNLARRLGTTSFLWNYRAREDATGCEKAQKLSMETKLWKGLAFTGAREKRLNRAPASPDAPLVPTTDARWGLTQSLGKATSISLGFARLKSAGSVQAGEQTLRFQAPLMRAVIGGEFTQRQAAGQPLAIIQGLSIANEAPDRRLGWRAHYKRRTRGVGGALETKGWAAGYRGAGKAPLPITASYLGNPETNGVALPGKQTALEISAPVAPNLALATVYRNLWDQATRKGEERAQVSLSGPVGADEKLTFMASTARLLEPAGPDTLQRTRLTGIRFEYAHGAGEEQVFSIGTDINYKTVDGAAHTYGCEYRADVKWARSF